MTVSHKLWALLVFFITAYSYLDSAFCSAHCGTSPQVLDSNMGEIRSSSYHTWYYRFGSICDCWVIKGSENEPIVFRFSRFFVKCDNEWVSLESSAGGEPVVLCGKTLPEPLRFPGGNITVVHHFFPHQYPVSKFILSYSRESENCPKTSFQCPGGQCIPLFLRCNGRIDCPNDNVGTDEQGCEDDMDYPEIQTTADGNKDSVKQMVTEKTKILVKTTPGYVYEDFWQLERTQNQLGQEHTQTKAEVLISTTPVEWPCGGLFQTFYGTFSSPAPRGNRLFCVWSLDPQDSRALRLDLRQLELGPLDRLTIYNRGEGKGDVIKNITSASNYKSIQVESHTGLMSLTYETFPGSEGTGFKATFHVGSYCPPSEYRCGGSMGGCYSKEQRCDGKWDCPETGKDEEACRGCGVNQFACGMVGQKAVAPNHFPGRPVCYPVTERCNYQLYCADLSDEKDCTVCQPGTFHCDSDRCLFESWRCDGQVDCKDGTDELNCTVMLPRKVITAATVGSLVCGLLLVIAMGCTCKLYSLRTREYSMFAPISRQEAQLIQQQAPPSYGQLIAQGVIPPVEDFPTENPNETSTLSLRGILQLLRQDAASSPHRRRRPRFVRRAVRRMRRWGLIPRQASRQSQSQSSNPQQSNSAPPGEQPAQSTPTSSSSVVEAALPPVSQKLGLLSATEQQQEAPLLQLPSTDAASLPPPPYAPPAPPHTTPCTPQVSVPSSSPSLASIFQMLGLSISLFRASPSSSSTSSSSTNSMPLSASPSFSSSSLDDEVLLIPLSEDNTSEDDVPMLT